MLGEGIGREDTRGEGVVLARLRCDSAIPEQEEQRKFERPRQLGQWLDPVVSAGLERLGSQNVTPVELHLDWAEVKQAHTGVSQRISAAIVIADAKRCLKFGAPLTPRRTPTPTPAVPKCAWR